jgi:hydroxypyruvate isomerase
MELNIKENHDEQEKLLSATIDDCVANGVPNIIVFAGYRTPGGMSDQEAADNCVAFLKRIKTRAEDKGVNICMEFLNSKVNHRGYIFDHIDWGVDVMNRVDSTRVGFLYDIYHAAIDDGDVTRTIHNQFKYMKHFHTAGNPGRNELSDDQELNYRYIAKVIAELNYTGYVGHEYNPTQGADPTACLKQAFEIFDV